VCVCQRMHYLKHPCSFVVQRLNLSFVAFVTFGSSLDHHTGTPIRYWLRTPKSFKALAPFNYP
jgi:hypothetical protein